MVENNFEFNVQRIHMGVQLSARLLTFDKKSWGEVGAIKSDFDVPFQVLEKVLPLLQLCQHAEHKLDARRSEQGVYRCQLRSSARKTNKIS